MEIREVVYCEDYLELMKKIRKDRKRREIMEFLRMQAYEINIENGTFIASRDKRMKKMKAMPAAVRKNLEWLKKNN